MNFEDAFHNLTGNPPFPWQISLYERFISDGEKQIPRSCNLPTGMGKTSVVAIWLIALANFPQRVPRRLVYVVNRRTVVDQTTDEVERYREKIENDASLEPLREQLSKLCAWTPKNSEGKAVSPLALSTLRGDFADNREWSADPSRPAVIVGTVDMIGSRLLFSGYGIGWKLRPLHAAFLGHDVILVHDEAHLEPAFQQLLRSIEFEQSRASRLSQFRVMELSATSRDENTFTLEDADRENPTVNKRLHASKMMSFHEIDNEKDLSEHVAKLAMSHSSSGSAVIVFVRKVEDVEKIIKLLPPESTQQLTGTMRGRERNLMADPTKKGACPIFARFLKQPDLANPTITPWNVEPQSGTVFLVCTSAGEVGVNISADHLVCDLSTLDSMAQRFGRVNRFGDNDCSTISVVAPSKFDDEDDLEQRRALTVKLLKELDGDASPSALESIGKGDREIRIQAFAPQPKTLNAGEILFNAWSMTSIREDLPGRPFVEPYLHGVDDRQPSETYVAWREEVKVIRGNLLTECPPEELLEDYPLKPHELLKDNTNRVFDRLKRLKAPPETPFWILSPDGTVDPNHMLAELADLGKESLESKTVLLPPGARGLIKGLLSVAPASNDVTDEFYDVADEVYFEGHRRRMRVKSPSNPQNDPEFRGMRLIRTIDPNPRFDSDDSEDSQDKQFWYWFELPISSDSDPSKTARRPVDWQVHTDDVVDRIEQIVRHLAIPNDIKAALNLAAKFHDFGKKRVAWQRSIGNPNPTSWLAKSGGRMVPTKLNMSYRHEFGSLVDVHKARGDHVEQFRNLPNETRDLIFHLIGAHHGSARPHFAADYVVDPTPDEVNIQGLADDAAVRFGRLQQRFGPWGLAYLESLLRAADYAASAEPTRFLDEGQ